MNEPCKLRESGMADNTVVLIFTEAGHVYYQECNPGDGGDGQ